MQVMQIVFMDGTRSELYAKGFCNEENNGIRVFFKSSGNQIFFPWGNIRMVTYVETEVKEALEEKLGENTTTEEASNEG